MFSLKLKIIIIGVAAAVSIPLVYAAAATLVPKCSFEEVYLPYNEENTRTWAQISKIILIGTVKDVEVRLVEQIGDTGEGPTGQYAISKMPYRFVTVEVDDYLVDRTGRYAEEITFRTWANGCIDAFGNFSPMERPDYVEYKEGQKLLLTVQDQSHDNGILIQGHYTYKFDIVNRNGIEFVEPNEVAAIPEMKLADLENEIRAAIESAP